MTQFLVAIVPVVLDKLGNLFVEYVTKQAYPSGFKAGYAAGVKVGLLYGAGGALLLVVVVGAIIFIIKQMQQSPKLAYGI